MTIPWEREWLHVTPTQFERMVVDQLRTLGRRLKNFTVEHQVPLETPDGEFTMDGVATFEALGADFLVLVECKHHRNPIKRDVVQVLSSKLSSAHAQKAMVFSTAPFQKGAVELALAHRIALVHFTEGGPVYETRGVGGPIGPKRPYDAYLVRLTENGSVSYLSGASDDLAEMLFGDIG